MSEIVWSAEANIYNELSNPRWAITPRFAGRLIVLAGMLPEYNKGIPCIISKKNKGCIIANSDGRVLTSMNGIVILIAGKEIEIKEDADYIIENEILRSAPWNVYKEIYHYL